MGALIDASVLIAGERGELDLDRVLERDAQTQLALSAITASELLHGVHRANTESRRTRREAFVEAILTSFPIISFDFVAARTHARLWARLLSKGRTIGAHDLLIAATAISRELGVVTRDQRSFPEIPGLSVHVW